MLRHCLHFGPYRTSNGPIPWPIGQTHRAKSLVLYRGLARAVRHDYSCFSLARRALSSNISSISLPLNVGFSPAGHGAPFLTDW